jgi:hypothetical protein
MDAPAERDARILPECRFIRVTSGALRRAGLKWPSRFQKDLQMPIRTSSSVSKKISANGQALHRAMMSRMESGGSDKEPSEAESALREERRQLEEEREKRKAQALLPKPTALDKLVRTHHPQARAKARKEAHDPHETKKPKAHRTRAEKHAEKAAAVEAARRAPKKPAK